MINSNNQGSRATPIAVMLVCALVLGCAQAEAPGSTASTPVTKYGEPASLLIQGYNYTDDYIDSFTVNGQGGGNVSPSGPYTGGGGGVCCVSYRPGTPLPIKLKVRWVAGYCIQRVMSPYPYGKPYYDNRRSLWREADALAVDVSKGEPRALEVHFYPDGHLEAAISDGNTHTRLNLQVDEKGERPGVTHNYPKCTDDQIKQSGQ
ncbi:MAG: DUF3304 domain-containing protein [Aquabacterium sp.]|nr:DUF3304 domain-containing protein [Aquabacterium sp.]